MTERALSAVADFIHGVVEEFPRVVHDNAILIAVYVVLFPLALAIGVAP